MTKLPFLSKIFYAVLLSSLQPRQSLLKQFRAIFSKNNSSYERMIRVAALVDRLIPGSVKWLSGWMAAHPRFPWKPVDTELIAYGTGAAVFKLDLGHGPQVLRIYRRSLGRSCTELVDIAGYYKKNYEMIVDWYGNIPDLVLPMDFFAFDGFPWVGPMAASFQPYVDGKKFDLFEDFSDSDLLKLFEASNFLREQFVLFANQTIQQWNGRTMCYDFLGRENILLVKQDGNFRLNIVDVGIFKFDLAEHNTPDKMARIEKRIERLTELCRQAVQSVEHR